MELWSLLALKPSFPLFWSSWENHLLTQAGCCVLNSRRGHNEDTSSTSLKYYIQNITFNNHQPQNNYANVSLYYIRPFPLGNYIEFNREK